MVSVGETLKRARELKGISLKEIEKRIKIREKYLVAIEKDDWNYFSSKIYIIGVIKNYSNFLGIDPKKLLAFFRRDYARKEDVRFKQKIHSDLLTPETRKVLFIFLGAVIIFFISYFGYQLNLFLSPPKVVFITPFKESYTQEDRVRVVGKTDKDAAVTILGERVYQDKDGVFEYSFPLAKGKNELVIEVVGANGKKTTLKKEFIKN